MRLFTAFALTVASTATLWATPAAAKTPTQAAFHDAFRRMDAHWPNISSHDYWLALRDAEDLAVKLSGAERRSDLDVERDLKVFQVYRNCWMALVAKEKAVSEFVIGQMVLQNDPHNLEAAREHFALSLASWEQAFRLWPYLVRENVRGDDPSDPTGHANLVGTGHAWRAQAQTHLARTTVR